MAVVTDSGSGRIIVSGGPAGGSGAAGASAYEVWLASGNSGTVQQFLSSLQGRPGATDPTAAIAAVRGLLNSLTAEDIGGLSTLLADKAAVGGIVGPDLDWPIPSDAVHVVIPVLTTSRTWSLPDVDGYPSGQDLVIVDEGRFLGAGPSLTLIPLAGSGDAIAGYPSGITLADAGASVRLRRGLLSDVWVVV